MADRRVVARSPIARVPPTTVVAGWEVSTRRTDAELRLADCSPLAKVLLHGPEGGAIERVLGVPHHRAVRDHAGRLVVGAGPGEWLVLADPDAAGEVADELRTVAAGTAEFAAVIDVTHGRALMRLTGHPAAALLTKVCAVDLAADNTPNGTAFSSSVARLTTDVVRDDVGGVPSYLLHCDWSYGQYLFDALLDAGAEFGIALDGFTAPEA